MKRIFYLLFFVSPVFFHSCEKDIDSRKFSFINNSDKDVVIHLADMENIYPDTTLSKYPPKTRLKSGGTYLFSGYKKQKGEYMYLYLFDPDTLSRYSWDIIREEYKILKRYKLKMSDMESPPYTVTYP